MKQEQNKLRAGTKSAASSELCADNANGLMAISMKQKLKAADEECALSERACENYACRYCGAKMNAANFVNGVLIQVFATHRDGCRSIVKNNYKTGEMDCSSCRWVNDNNQCCYDGPINESIAGLHY